MSNSEHFHPNVDSQEYRINHSFNCDLSDVVYLLECTVSRLQYVTYNMLESGNTCTPFRLRLNNYKSCSLVIRGPQYPRLNSSEILLNKATRGF